MLVVEMVVVLVFSLRITTISHIEFTRAQFNHRIVPGQAVKQFTSTTCLHFRKELKTVHARAEVQYE
jgi:hypothetical protein